MRLQSLVDLLNNVVVLDVTPPVARKFGEIQAALVHAGHPAPAIDLLIGSTALVHGLVLVTHNVKDFASIPALTIVDWLSP